MAQPSVLVCATDAGGGRNISPVIEALARRGCSVTAVISPTVRRLCPEIGGAGTEVCLMDAGEVQAVRRLAQKVRPAAIVCGTTRHFSFERELVRWGQEAGIRSVVVLDEWYRFRERFEDAQGHLTCLPTAVAVPDALAFRDAVAEGLPAERCHITGSPNLMALTDLAMRFQESPPARPAMLGEADRPVVTFLSETHVRDYGSGPGEAGSLGTYLGYTERSVRDEVVEALARLVRPVLLVEKPHPADERTPTPMKPTKHIEWRYAATIDLWPLLWHSDLVVGMRSMALLEACLLGCRAISYQPGLLGPDMCTAVRLGLTHRLDTQRELEAWLRLEWPRPDRPTRPRMIRHHAFASRAAADRVVDLALAGSMQQAPVESVSS